MYGWSMIGQTIPLLCRAPLNGCIWQLIETNTIWMGKGCSFSWCKFHVHTTYGWGVLLAVHLVVDNQRHTLFHSKQRHRRQTTYCSSQCPWRCHLLKDQGCLAPHSTKWYLIQNDRQKNTSNWPLLRLCNNAPSTPTSRWARMLPNWHKLLNSDFGETVRHKEMLRDRLVCGITNDKWQQCLLAEESDLHTIKPSSCWFP